MVPRKGRYRMRLEVRKRVWITLGLLPGLLAAGVAQANEVGVAVSDAETAMYGTFNNGEDLTLPKNQIQVRQRFERLPDDGGRTPEKWVTTARADFWTGLGGGWKLYGRLDQTLVYSNNVTSPFNPNGRGRFGQGDLQTEIAVIMPPPTARLGYGLGVRAIWPTAGLNEVGDGKYQVGPVAGARLSLPEITVGSYFAPQAVYLNSVASRNENKRRADINRLKIRPKLDIALPGDWFAIAFASKDIEINFAEDAKLFVPFDLMVGTKLFDKFIASVEYSRSLFHDKGFEPYQWQIEARLGYFF